MKRPIKMTTHVEIRISRSQAVVLKNHFHEKKPGLLKDMADSGQD